MIEVLTTATMAIISQYIFVNLSNQRVVCLKLTQCYLSNMLQFKKLVGIPLPVTLKSLP